MSRKVTEIPQTKQDVPIEVRQLRVAAYCRVSTHHAVWKHRLPTTQIIPSVIQTGSLLQYIRILHPASVQQTALVTGSS